jgi:hypothetical protein
VEVADLEDQVEASDRQLQELGIDAARVEALAAAAVPGRGWLVVLGRPILRWRQRRVIGRLMGGLDQNQRAKAAELQQLLVQRQRLRMQLQSMEATRRLLALWYWFHIPLSGVLFTLAAIHIAAVLYYAAFMK